MKSIYIKIIIKADDNFCCFFEAASYILNLYACSNLLACEKLFAYQ